MYTKGSGGIWEHTLWTDVMNEISSVVHGKITNQLLGQRTFAL